MRTHLHAERTEPARVPATRGDRAASARDAAGDASPLADTAQRANAGPHAASLARLQSVTAQRRCPGCGAVRRGMGGAPAQRAAAGDAGLPDDLRAGLEGLSGRDLSGVRVHYGSPRPAQLYAHAYAQGPDIHLAPGQEHHLPHEGWHAVQQMESRVRPTAQLAGTSVNDDAGLEREADVMGARALREGRASRRRDAPEPSAGHAVQRGAAPANAPVQRAWEIDEFNPLPAPYYVDWETGETYDPNLRLAGKLAEKDQRELTPVLHRRMMRRIRRDIDLDFQDEFDEASEFLRSQAVLDEDWAEVLGDTSDEIAERFGLDESLKVLKKLIKYLEKITGALGERENAFRPETRKYVRKQILEHAEAIAQGKEGSFVLESFGQVSDQEMLAQQLVKAKKGKEPERFKKILAGAEPRIEEIENGLVVTFYLGTIRLGEVTLVQIKKDTVELHFNTEEPLQYIGVASELWNQGLAVLEKYFPKIRKMDVILPSYSGASSLIVTRQLANLGGDVTAFGLGQKAGKKRKSKKNVESSVSEQHEHFTTGGQDESTAEETRHYLRSVAKSVYSHAYGLVGYLNPWKLLKAYGISPEKLSEKVHLALSEEQMGNTSTLAGLVEVARAHELLGLKYDAKKFATAVEDGEIKLILGVQGESLIDFSLQRTTLATLKRWAELKFL